jgi:glycerophosphoryl diester phosphodiesterase
MFKPGIAIVFIILSVCAIKPVLAQKKDAMHVLKLKSPQELHSFFKYTGRDIMLISGHRGGMVKGFPENSIATFENTLRHTPAFFEIDPRLTKDSVVILMHDATLDRTTTGKGKVSDYTYEQLKQFRLRDAEGNVTEYPIPTLSEVIEWARGKTILNLDHKDVPLETTARLIREHHAGAFVMVTVHSPAEAEYYLSHNPESMFSAFVKNKKDFESYEKASVPFSQMIAYIGPTVKPENKELYALLNRKGTMCMISAASSYDKLKNAEERKAAYRSVVQDGASILETDFPIEAARAIADLTNKKSTKKKFFGMMK